MIGVILNVAIVLTTQTNLEAQKPFLPRKAPAVQSDFGWLPQQARPQRKAMADTTAVTLEAVTMQGCPPCKRLKKETIPNLVMMGYDVVLVTRLTDTRGTTQFPTLYYLDAKGNVVLKQIGFQTAEEVIKHLGKPNEKPRETHGWLWNPLRRYVP